jgi:LmbE family N-acetylglucosaminyl deacetylase
MEPRTDPYRDWLGRLADLLEAELPVPPPAAAGAAAVAAADPAAPRCLLLSPHPDDECIVGALPLRLRREHGWRVVNCAVTLGSRQDRRDSRLAELEQACARLDFGLELPAPGGLERVDLQTRAADAQGWQRRVAAVVCVLQRWQPQLVLLPHAGDASATHQGVHALGVEAIERAGRAVAVAFTEYWGTLPTANLLVETSLDDTASLVSALACHVGEVARNPYHRLLPAWMADTVRRGGELVLGAGSRPPQARFATAYRLQLFDGAAWRPAAAGGFFAAAEPLDTRVLELPGATPLAGSPPATPAAPTAG